MNLLQLFYLNVLIFSIGQVARLTKDLENSEKKLRDTRNSMSQQSGKKEAEYQQIITNINRTTTQNITKLKEEKVRNYKGCKRIPYSTIFHLLHRARCPVCTIILSLQVSST